MIIIMFARTVWVNIVLLKLKCKYVHIRFNPELPIHIFIYLLVLSDLISCCCCGLDINDYAMIVIDRSNDGGYSGGLFMQEHQVGRCAQCDIRVCRMLVHWHTGRRHI